MKDSSIQLRSESRLIVTEELASQLVALSTSTTYLGRARVPLMRLLSLSPSRFIMQLLSLLSMSARLAQSVEHQTFNLRVVDNATSWLASSSVTISRDSDRNLILESFIYELAS